MLLKHMHRGTPNPELAAAGPTHGSAPPESHAGPRQPDPHSHHMHAHAHQATLSLLPTSRPAPGTVHAHPTRNWSAQTTQPESTKRLLQHQAILSRLGERAISSNSWEQTQKVKQHGKIENMSQIKEQDFRKKQRTLVKWREVICLMKNSKK